MEKTVKIPLDEYLELRDFKKSIDDGKVYVKIETENIFSTRFRYMFLAPIEIPEKMESLVEGQKEYIDKLKVKIESLEEIRRVLNAENVDLQKEVYNLQTKSVKSVSWFKKLFTK